MARLLNRAGAESFLDRSRNRVGHLPTRGEYFFGEAAVGQLDQQGWKPFLWNYVNDSSDFTGADRSESRSRRNSRIAGLE